MIFSGQRLCSTPAITSRRPSHFPARRLQQERSARSGDGRVTSVVTTGVTTDRHSTRDLPSKKNSVKESVSEIAEGARKSDKKAVDKSVALLGALESWDRKNDNARQTADVAGEFVFEFNDKLFLMDIYEFRRFEIRLDLS